MELAEISFWKSDLVLKEFMVPILSCLESDRSQFGGTWNCDRNLYDTILTWCYKIREKKCALKMWYTIHRPVFTRCLAFPSSAPSALLMSYLEFFLKPCFLVFCSLCVHARIRMCACISMSVWTTWNYYSWISKQWKTRYCWVTAFRQFLTGFISPYKNMVGWGSWVHCACSTPACLV